MPIPLLVWGLGALVTGLAAGKGGQMVGDNAANEAKSLVQNHAAYLERRRQQFHADHQKLGRRLVTYSVLLRGMIGETPPQEEESEVPEYMAELLKTITTPWKGSTGYKTNDQVWRMTSDDQNLVRGAIAATRLSPNAAPAAQVAVAFLYAKKGIVHALQAGESLDRVRAWERESRMAVEAEIEKLASQFAMMEEIWDTKVVPNAKKALGPPRDVPTLQMLAACADVIEQTAKARLNEIGSDQATPDGRDE